MLFINLTSCNITLNDRLSIILSLSSHSFLTKLLDLGCPFIICRNVLMPSYSRGSTSSPMLVFFLSFPCHHFSAVLLMISP
jgi:hypothetical protein